MKRFSARCLPLATAIAVAAMVGGCTLAMVESIPVWDQAEVENTLPRCQSTLGSYTLPKHVFHFTITKKATDNFHVLNKIESVDAPDNRHVFCLDHLRSAFADDEIKVFKNKVTREKNTANNTPYTVKQDATPYLQLVASKAVDHTAAIARNFIKVAFIAITNKGDFTSARSAIGTGTAADQPITVADLQVDPFDYQEMARVNEATRPLGFCFVLEDHTFDRSIGDRRPNGHAANAYCNAPVTVAQKSPPPSARAIAEMRYLVRKPVSGIFFRPRASYRLTVYVKPDPNGPGAWRPGLMKNYEFENIMPVVSVGIDRAVFATRRTGLVFDDGMLKNVCIAKGSEVLGGLAIPLEIIYGIIALPTAFLQAGAAQDTLQKQLFESKLKLVNAQNNYIKFLAREPDVKPAISGSQPGPSLGVNADIAAKIAKIDTDIAADRAAIAIDPIAPASGGDALADICVELMAATTGTGANARTF